MNVQCLGSVDGLHSAEWYSQTGPCAACGEPWNTRETLAGTLHRLVMLKAQAKEIATEVGTLEQALKVELTSDPAPIIDGEHRISAVLKERKAPAEFDLITFADAPDSGLLIQAARQGLLSVRTTQVRGLAGKSPAADALLNKYEMAGGVTYTLVVEEA